MPTTAVSSLLSAHNRISDVITGATNKLKFTAGTTEGCSHQHQGRRRDGGLDSVGQEPRGRLHVHRTRRLCGDW